MRFSSWWFLLLLALVPILFRIWKRRSRPARVVFPLAIPKTVGSRFPTGLLLGLKCAGWALLVVSLARPQSSFRQQDRTVSGIDIMMVMDVSLSMNIEDLEERTRLDLSKEMMENFIRGRQNNRIGFVIFSGEPLTLSPPTLDYLQVIKSLRDVELGVLKDGTGIGDGLALAVGHLRESKAKSRVIVLLTDGDNNVGQVDPGTAGELARGYGIRVYTIAMGREGRVRLKLPGGGPPRYQWFENALNPELLEQIAAATNGKFYRVTEADALERVFSEIDQLEKSDIKQNEKIRYDEIFQKPLSWAMLLLLLEQLLARGWWRVIP
jgi:Ca-activated chloride channel family protein